MGPGSHGGDSLPARRIHAAARRVVKIRHQISQARRGLGEGGGKAVNIPACMRQRHPDRAAGYPLNRRDSQRVSGVIHHYPIAWPGEHAQYQRQPADGAVNHHHLFCPGRQAARRIACGDGFAQGQQSQLVIAGLRQMLRHGGQGMGIGLMDLRPGTQGGGGEIQRRTGVGAGRGRAAVGKDHPRSAAVSAFEVALIPQMGKGAADGGPADFQR